MLQREHTYREMFPGYVADCEVPDDSENLFGQDSLSGNIHERKS